MAGREGPIFPRPLDFIPILQMGRLRPLATCCFGRRWGLRSHIFLFTSGRARAKTSGSPNRRPAAVVGGGAAAPPAEMLRQWSVQSGQAPGEPAGEELWESEVQRLRSSQAPVRTLPYAMVDRRFIRWVPGRRPPPSRGAGGGAPRGCASRRGGGRLCLAGAQGG